MKTTWAKTHLLWYYGPTYLVVKKDVDPHLVVEERGVMDPPAVVVVVEEGAVDPPLVLVVVKDGALDTRHMVMVEEGTLNSTLVVVVEQGTLDPSIVVVMEEEEGALCPPPTVEECAICPPPMVESVCYEKGARNGQYMAHHGLRPPLTVIVRTLMGRSTN
jgi:hypothetical protein